MAQYIYGRNAVRSLIESGAKVTELFVLDALANAEVDVQDIAVADDGEMTVKVPKTDFAKAQDAIEKMIPGVEFDTCEITMLPAEWTSLTTDEDKEGLKKLLDMLDECDDVNSVYTNVKEAQA